MPLISSGSAPLLCLQVFGRENPFCEDRPAAPQRAADPLSPARRRPASPRLSERPAIRQRSALAYQLANALFQTVCRFDELIQLTWVDCRPVGKEIVAPRIKGNGSMFHDMPVPDRLNAALLKWRDIQESFKARRIMAPSGIAFAESQFVFAGIPKHHFRIARSIFGCAPRAERSG